jgi:hypothetical protein
MKRLTIWIRKLHRWLVVPFLAAIIVLLAGTITQGEGYEMPGWLTAAAIVSLLSLFLTGLYMFVQHYGAKWRRARRSSRRQERPFETAS